MSPPGTDIVSLPLPVPSMWREEVYHPLVAHFPIALLVFATVLYLAYCLTRRSFFHSAFLLNLVAGVGAAWLSIYLGQIAEDVVNRVICDPTMTHEHEDFAFYSAWTFSGVLAVCLIQFYSEKFRNRMAEFLILLLLLSGVILLSYAGHLGATLVYQQGAAVYHPSPDCTEFE